MTDSEPPRAAAQPATGGAAREVSVSEIDVVQTEAPPASPVRKIVLIALGVLLALFVYHVLSDRYTPYTSQARVETFLTQVAPEVAGDVLEVGAKDNSPVKKGQLLFRIDPEPYQVAIRSAEANLAVALQAADVSVADVAAARAQVRKQRVDLAASRQLGKIVTDLVGRAGARRNSRHSCARGHGKDRSRCDQVRSRPEAGGSQFGHAWHGQFQGPPGPCRTRPGAARSAQHDGRRSGRRNRHQPPAGKGPICRARSAVAELP